MQGTFSQLNDSAQTELWACMALRNSLGLGFRRLPRLRAYFGSANAALTHAAEWGSLGINSEIIRACKTESWRVKATQEWADFKRLGCGVILWEALPRLLQEINDPPLCLYYWGQPSLLQAPCIAVVGSRLCSHQGLHHAAILSRDLARAGFPVVSGLAKGIDREAHLAALPEIGSSVAVLGSGIDQPYPRENIDVFEALAQSGLILSELPPGSPPSTHNFPIRNRIISGISLGVVVVEAAARSGSLITARHALEQNRQVYAMPGNPNAESSFGCQELLRQGAVMTRGVSDIIFDLKEQLAILVVQDAPKAGAAVVPQSPLAIETRVRVKVSSPAREPVATDISVPDISATKALGPEALGPEVLGPEVLGPEVLGPEVLGPEALGPEALGPEVTEQTGYCAKQSKKRDKCDVGTASAQKKSQPENLSPLEMRVLETLYAYPQGLQIDQLARLLDNAGTEKLSGKLAGLLIMLEVAGRVSCKPGLRYVVN